MRSPTAFTLGSHEISFLQFEALSILVAARGPGNVPYVARALACRLSADHHQITVFFPTSDAHELLHHIENNGAIAVVFTRPSTHEAIQLKGVDARPTQPLPTDLDFVTARRQAFVDHVGALGYPRDLIHMMLFCEPGDLAAVTFTPSSAFMQTPGPHAGDPYGAAR